MLLLLTGESVSTFGDAFFNVAVVWVVWVETRSVLQTAIIQVLWHTSDVLFASIAGVVADRLDRRRIMIISNFVAAGVVGMLATITVGLEHFSVVVAFGAIFLLNTATTFMAPARASILPEMTGRGGLATASGIFATARQGASVVGNATAGAVVTILGAVFALVVDALSFIVAALCVAVAVPSSPAVRPSVKPSHPAVALRRQIAEGWKAISDHPVLKALVGLSVLINLTAFLGPLWPALVDQQLRAGAEAYGLLAAAGVIGGMLGGALAGRLERRVGAGPLIVGGWGAGGLCVIGMGASTWLPVTAALEAMLTLGMTAAAVASGALITILAATEVRGRVFGITRSISTLAIPASALLGAWIADRVGVVPMYFVAGAYMVVIAALAWSNSFVRAARV